MHCSNNDKMKIRLREEGHTWWRRKMETLQSLPGFYPRGRREGQSLISFVISYPSKRRLLVDSMALSTVRMACSMDVLTKVSPSLLMAGTVETHRWNISKHEQSSARVYISNRTRVFNKEVGVIPNTSPAHLPHSDAQSCTKACYEIKTMNRAELLQ